MPTGVGPEGGPGNARALAEPRTEIIDVARFAKSGAKPRADMERDERREAPMSTDMARPIINAQNGAKSRAEYKRDGHPGRHCR